MFFTDKFESSVISLGNETAEYLKFHPLESSKPILI